MIRESLGTVKLGIKNLMLHKLRSALTTLGLLIGVAAVVAMLAIGEGASYEAQQQIKALGSTNILIRSIKPPANEEAANQSSWSAQIYGLTYDDASRIRATLAATADHALEELVPVRLAEKEIRVGQRWDAGAILGTTPAYLDVMGMEMQEGRWLTQLDNRRHENVAVLGAKVAKRFFPVDNPMGKVIRTSGDRFLVIGVLAELGRNSGTIGRSVDECIYIPIDTSKVRFGEFNIKRTGGSRSVESVQLHEIKVKLNSEDAVLPASKMIKSLLVEHHSEVDYTTTVPLELLREAEEVKRRFQLLLFFIASISLIVGGIGIMNVMLATVTERTREIGIRRALGARRGHIVYQFLVETVILSAAGGFLGLLFGVTTPLLATYVWDTHAIIRPIHPVLAFSISAVVGIIAGLYPAWRAANMDPVEALRHE